MEPLAPLFTLDAQDNVTIEFSDFPRHTVLRAEDVERLADALWKIAADAPSIRNHLVSNRLKRTRRFYSVAPPEKPNVGAKR